MDTSKYKYDIHKAAGILIRDRKILVEKSKDKEFFIAPGGSIEQSETSEQALIRELMEEFQIRVSESDLEEFGVFCHPAAGQDGKMVCMEVFTVKKWRGEIKPDNEVEKILWLSSEIPQNLKVGSIIEQEIVPTLKEKDLID